MSPVIGAGARGLATAREPGKCELSLMSFDLHVNVRGNRGNDNLHAPLYESAHLILARHMTAFAEFPISTAISADPCQGRRQPCCRDHARRFERSEHYRFNTRVLAVERSGDV